MRVRLTAWLPGLLAAAAAGAEPIPAGRGRSEISSRGAPLTVFTYRPENYGEGALLVVFHGVVRHAEQDRFGPK